MSCSRTARCGVLLPTRRATLRWTAWSRSALVHLGRIDTLVNSAGIDGAGASALDLTCADWRRVLEVNLTGPFLVARAVARATMRVRLHEVATLGAVQDFVAAANTTHGRRLTAEELGVQILHLAERDPHGMLW